MERDLFPNSQWRLCMYVRDILEGDFGYLFLQLLPRGLLCPRAIQHQLRLLTSNHLNLLKLLGPVFDLRFTQSSQHPWHAIRGTLIRTT